MPRQRNWSAFTGLLLGFGAIAAYFLLVLTHDPSLHRWLESPVANLIAVGAGLALSFLGVRQALRRTHSGRVLAPVLATLNLVLAGLFGWYLFVYSYQMPAAARAPAVGTAAPDFALRDDRGKEVRLSSLRGQPVVLIFYRGHW